MTWHHHVPVQGRTQGPSVHFDPGPEAGSPALAVCGTRPASSGWGPTSHAQPCPPRAPAAKTGPPGPCAPAPWPAQTPGGGAVTLPSAGLPLPACPLEGRRAIQVLPRAHTAWDTLCSKSWPLVPPAPVSPTCGHPGSLGPAPVRVSEAQTSSPALPSLLPGPGTPLPRLTPTLWSG